MFKAFTTKLSSKRRNVLKSKVLMAACTLLEVSRLIFYLSTRDCTNNDIVELMDKLAYTHCNTFLTRCRTMSKSDNEKKYVRHLANKHVAGILNYCFNEHIRRLNDMDTLMILNEGEETQRTFDARAAIVVFKKKQEIINKKFKTNII